MQQLLQQETGGTVPTTHAVRSQQALQRVQQKVPLKQQLPPRVQKTAESQGSDAQRSTTFCAHGQALATVAAAATTLADTTPSAARADSDT